MEHLRCVVERITYQNPQNGYSVIKCRAKGYSELVAVVGAMPDVHVGSVLSLGGSWKIDGRYGRQFTVETFEETLPATVYGIEKYLGSGLVKGIGPKYARKIVQEFGRDTLDVIEETPDALLKIPGIGRVRVEQIKKSWTEQKEIKNIMLFLQGHDVSTAHATKIYKTYGNESIQIVQENPYRLADDIWGIGFRTADTIAGKMGFDHEKYVRLRSGVIYSLNRLAEEGHCYATRDMLTKTSSELLEVDESLITMTLDEMIHVRDVITETIPQNRENNKANAPDLTEASRTQRQEGKGAENGPDLTEASRTQRQEGKGAETGSDLTEASRAQRQEGKGAENGPDLTEALAFGEIASGFRESEDLSADVPREAPAPEKAIYLPPFFFSENGTARRLASIFSNREGYRIDTRGLADRISRKTGMQYDDIQKQAIETSVRSKILILTGGPGTGKTTTTLGIITAFREAGARILLAAPTGRAAKRLSEATGMEARTIHRLLEMKPTEGYQKNEENPLNGDVLIVDECSMIDIMLMYNLLKAVPDRMTMILVGDVDQLPSVGAGNVLRDMIESGCFPVVRLTRIFRQAQTSRIIMNAHRINEGKMPDISNGRATDFFFMDMEKGIDAADPAARQLVAERAAGTIIELVTKKLSRYYRTPPREIQVLTPMQRGVVGAANLNQALQQAVNPGPDQANMHPLQGDQPTAGGYRNPASNQANARPLQGNQPAAGGYRNPASNQANTRFPQIDRVLRRGGVIYRTNDKVMQIRNNYDKEVFNGDIGYIESVDPEDRTLQVNFDNRLVEYDVTELDELVLAYATTIHKAQGSEYPIVVIPVLMNHYVMLQRNLIYTGVTRAKKILVLVGTKKALAYAVRHLTADRRNTMLAERLRRLFDF